MNNRNHLRSMAVFLTACLISVIVTSSGADRSTDGLLDCSANWTDNGQTVGVGDFILLECSWADVGEPLRLTGNVNVTTARAAVTVGAVMTSPTQDARPQLAWFRREVMGEISELTADHHSVVKWRLAPDDNGIEFFCAPTDGTKVLSAPTCSQTPLVVPPDVSITSSPGTHYLGEGNTFTCVAAAMPDVKTHEWHVNGVKVFPDHDPNFSGDFHIIVDDENDHKHRHLTYDRLNATDNSTQISCTAWTTTGISNNASILLIVTTKQEVKSSFLEDSVVLLACLAAGGAPVVFLICVCIIWGVRRSRRRDAGKYSINYSGSFKSDEDVPASDTHTSLPRQFESSNNHTDNHNQGHNQHGSGKASAAIQRPNFFRQKLNRLSQMFFNQPRYAEEESIYENTNPSHTTTFSSDFGGDRNGSVRGGDVSRGGSLPLSHRHSTLSKSTSSPLAMSSPSQQSPEQEYENFVPPPPSTGYENNASILDSPSECLSNMYHETGH